MWKGWRGFGGFTSGGGAGEGLSDRGFEVVAGPAEMLRIGFFGWDGGSGGGLAWRCFGWAGKAGGGLLNRGFYREWRVRQRSCIQGFGCAGGAGGALANRMFCRGLGVGGGLASIG